MKTRTKTKQKGLPRPPPQGAQGAGAGGVAGDLHIEEVDGERQPLHGGEVVAPWQLRERRKRPRHAHAGVNGGHPGDPHSGACEAEDLGRSAEERRGGRRDGRITGRCTRFELCSTVLSLSSFLRDLPAGCPILSTNEHQTLFFFSSFFSLPKDN